MAKCSHQGCARPATHMLEMRAHMVGRPHNNRNVLRSRLHLVACLRHASEMTRRPDVLALAWRGINDSARAMQVEPDRSTAKISAVWGIKASTLKDGRHSRFDWPAL